MLPYTGGAYINGMGNTTKVERFLPGLGNVMHVPGTLGGVTGGAASPPPALLHLPRPVVSRTTPTGNRSTGSRRPPPSSTCTTGAVTGTASAGAGCYTLGATTHRRSIITTDVTVGLEGPSVTGAGGPATESTDTWGGCDDHTAGQGNGNHGFLKQLPS